jgi:hypothetical protein
MFANEVLHLPQKFERLPLWNVWTYWIKEYDVKVSFDGMTSLLNVIKSTNWFKNYYRGHMMIMMMIIIIIIVITR